MPPPNPWERRRTTSLRETAAKAPGRAGCARFCASIARRADVRAGTPAVPGPAFGGVVVWAGVSTLRAPGRGRRLCFHGNIALCGNMRARRPRIQEARAFGAFAGYGARESCVAGAGG